MRAWAGAVDVIDLQAVPLTDRGSRLLIFSRPDGGLRVAAAVYERNPENCTHLRRIAVVDTEGRHLPITDVGPEGICFGDGAASLVFAGETGLSIGVPPEGSPAMVEFEPFGMDQHGRGLSEVDEAPISWLATEDSRIPPAEVSSGCVQLLIQPGGSVSLRVGETDGEAPIRGNHSKLMESATERWTNWFGKFPPVRERDAEMVRFAWWVLASNIVRLDTHPGIEAVVPSKQGYVAAWQWDSYFISIGLRHGDPELAADQLRLFFSEQAADGGLPDVVHDGGTLACVADMPRSDIAALARIHGKNSPMVTQGDMPISKPPLAAWAARAIDAVAGTALQAELREGLDRLHQWWFSRPSPDGLPGYEHVYSSGLDDSPLFDDGGPVFAPDLPSYLVLVLDSMADLADDAGDQLEAETQRSVAEETAKRLVSQRFDAQLGRFVTLTPAGIRQTLTPFSLMPLLTGRLPPQVLEALRATLSESNPLAAHFPLPTVALDEAEFNADRMWRGPVWLNVNWLVFQGLLRSGLEVEALDLAERTVAMVREGGGLHEYWNPLTGARAAGATTNFGWSAALFLDLAVWLASQRE